MISAGIYYVLSHGDSNQITGEYGDTINGFTSPTSKWAHNEEIGILRRYLQFPTISHQSNFGKNKIHSKIENRNQI